MISYGPEARETARTYQLPKGVAVMAIETNYPAGQVGDVLEGIEHGTMTEFAKQPGVLLAAEPANLIGLNAMTPPSAGYPWWPDPVADPVAEAVAREGAEGRRLDAELKVVGEDGRA